MVIIFVRNVVIEVIAANAWKLLRKSAVADFIQKSSLAAKRSFAKQSANVYEIAINMHATGRYGIFLMALKI